MSDVCNFNDYDLERVLIHFQCCLLNVEMQRIVKSWLVYMDLIQNPAVSLSGDHVFIVSVISTKECSKYANVSITQPLFSAGYVTSNLEVYVT